MKGFSKKSKEEPLTPALADQLAAFFKDAARLDRERMLARWGARATGGLNLEQRVHLAELDRRVAGLEEQARLQGLVLPGKSGKRHFIWGWQATAALLLATAFALGLAWWLLFLTFGAIIVHLSAIALFFSAGVWLGAEFTAKSMENEKYQRVAGRPLDLEETPRDTN